MNTKRLGFAAAALAVAALSLTACDRQASKPSRDGGGYSNSSGDKAARKAARRAAREGRDGGDGGAYDGGGRRGGAAAIGPMHADGTPMWAGNRKKDPDEQAERQFRKNGADFGAASKEDYVNKVHAFVKNPPAGVKTATRANGDKLFYDPRSNTFAVVNRRGAPRTMFKPRDGAAYWTQQMASLNERGRKYRDGGKAQARRDRNGGDNDDDAG
ncbi:MAG: hypothetical protein ACXWVJ_05605 [Caulobacteraceae bacterium]